MKKNTLKSDMPKTSPAQKSESADTNKTSAGVQAKETEENLEKMAKKLTKAWNKPLKASDVPDLSFSKFEEKLKNKDQ